MNSKLLLLAAILVQVFGVHGYAPKCKDGEECNLEFGLAPKKSRITTLIMPLFTMVVPLLGILLYGLFRMLLTPLRFFKLLSTPLLLVLNFIGSRTGLLSPVFKGIIKTFWSLCDTDTHQEFSITYTLLWPLKLPFRAIRFIARIPYLIVRFPLRLFQFIAHLPVELVSTLMRAIRWVVLLPFRAIMNILNSAYSLVLTITYPIRVPFLILARLPPFDLLLSMWNFMRYLIFQTLCRIFHKLLGTIFWILRLPLNILRLPITIIQNIIMLPWNIITFPFNIVMTVVRSFQTILLLPFNIFTGFIDYFFLVAFNIFQSIFINPVIFFLRPFLAPFRLVFRFVKFVTRFFAEPILCIIRYFLQ